VDPPEPEPMTMVSRFAGTFSGRNRSALRAYTMIDDGREEFVRYIK